MLWHTHSMLKQRYLDKVKAGDRAGLTEETRIEIRRLRAEGMLLRELAVQFDCGETTIFRVLNTED